MLTVARDVAGKGLGTARQAAARTPGVAWLTVTPDLAIGPDGVRALMKAADLVVVPSEGLVAGEGRPHVIAQALASGTAVLGGPAPAVRNAVAASGQAEVVAHGPAALARAVVRAAIPERLSSLTRRALTHSHAWRWPAAIVDWDVALRASVPASAHPL